VFKLFKKHKFTIFAITFPVLIFIKLSEDLIREELSIFDSSIYTFLSKFISPNFKFIMQFLSLSAYTPTLIVLTILIYFVFRNNMKYSKYWLIIAINLAVSDFIVEIFKIIFHRVRPDILRLVEVTGYSFPSGHSMVGMSFYGLIFYLMFINLNNYKKYVNAVLFALLIFFIGVSRVYLGVHYASDVLAGFSAGLAWLVIYITLIRRSYYFNLLKKNINFRY
jgi:undecaprenyl-diphosphatase